MVGIDNTSVVETVITRLREMICQGDLKVGDRLPPERTLAGQFGVSRASFREALRTMISLGVFETRQGSGTVVAHDASAVLDRPLELLIGLERPAISELYDARRVLEGGIVELAALRRSDEQMNELVKALQDLQLAVLDPKLRTEPNVRFHRTLAEMSGNVLLNRIMESLMLRISAAIEITNSVADDALETVSVHAAIVDAVRAQDPIAARTAMNRHMDRALNELDIWKKEAR